MGNGLSCGHLRFPTHAPEAARAWATPAFGVAWARLTTEDGWPIHDGSIVVNGKARMLAAAAAGVCASPLMRGETAHEWATPAFGVAWGSRGRAAISLPYAPAMLAALRE